MSNQVAHPSSGQDPPKKTSWTKRVICFFLPKRWHKYVTPEFLVAWNVSNYVTWAQAYALFHWEKVSLIFTTKVLPTASKVWVFLKDVFTDVLQMLHHTQ